MTKIEITVKDKASEYYNLEVKFDNKEVGMLYISADEYFDLIRILKKGADDVEIIEPDNLVDDDLDDQY
jgi:hypothetical protein